MTVYINLRLGINPMILSSLLGDICDFFLDICFGELSGYRSDLPRSLKSSEMAEFYKEHMTSY